MMQQGGSPCSTQGVNLSPPRRTKQPARVPLNRLWLALPDENRRRTLQTLSRVVAQQVASLPSIPEVTHEKP